jgi:hypothetical protein
MHSELTATMAAWKWFDVCLFDDVKTGCIEIQFALNEKGKNEDCNHIFFAIVCIA